MPTDNTNLSHVFTSYEYAKVAVQDQIYVSQCGHTGFTLFLWKDQFSSNTNAVIGRWVGHTHYAPSTSAVYLQVYNQVAAEWETVDSDNTTAAETDFTLEGGVRSNVANYYDIGNWVSFRIYQESKW